MSSPRDYGWQRITNVVVTVDRDQTGRIVGEYVEMLTADGSWYMLDGLRHDDPDAETVAAHYLERGWTDSRCLFMGAE